MANEHHLIIRGKEWLTNQKYLIDKISNCQILGIVLEPTQLWLCLEFIDPSDLKEVVLELHKMAYFSLSKITRHGLKCWIDLTTTIYKRMNIFFQIG
jgi:hypothetical protein